MSKYNNIIAKLEKFYKKFYINELLKGAILFFAIGFLYFLLTVFLEYSFWLNQKGRLILFWLFIAVEIGLFIRFILYPIFKLLKITKGISYEEAAEIIGKHFPEVNDKLLNILQLKKVGEQENSELLFAGIDQKAAELQPIPFQIAIDFKSNLPYLKYAAIPVVLFLLIWISGKSNLFSDSYTRVVNYQQVYEPPAPFSFYVLNENLKTNENEDFKLKVHTQGEIIPDEVKINYQGKEYLLNKEKNGEFTYNFERIKENTTFHLTGNAVRSRAYELEIINTPKLLDFELNLKYPAYLNKVDKTIKGTGNITIPEGTEITWNLNTEFTEKVKLELPDTILNFSAQQDKFHLTKNFYKNTAYQISTSNKNLEDFEKLTYQLKVIKDEFPEIKMQMKKDTLDEEKMYFRGQVSDDYGLQKLELVFYEEGEENKKQTRNIAVSKSNFDEFLYVFPDTLQLKKGTSYELYFQIFDNDGVNGSKVAKSETFTYRKRTDEEQERKQLEDQKESLQGMQESLEQLKSADELFEELDKMQKEKNSLNYNERKKFEDYMQKVRQDNEQMKNYTEKMKEDLDNFQKEKDDSYKDELKKRLEKNEERLKENEKLLEELEKYKDKIGQENLAKKIEEMAKNKKAQDRSLEEILELTKRYYVQKKAERLTADLNKLSKEQKELSEKEKENTAESQERLNKKFEEITESLEELQQENLKLRKPMDLGRDEAKERSVGKDQEEATENLEESENQENKQENQKDNSSQDAKNKAKKNQQSAAEKMRQLAQGMQMQMQMGDQEQMAEDARALRQILDNLIVFSFSQEDLMIDFQNMENESPDFGNRLQYQQTLRENFKHVDDSLYALALRNPMISDQITTKLIDVDFNMDKALKDLAKFNLQNGTMNQQYVLTDANDLANLLDNVLQNMESMMMQAEGSGEGEGMPQPGEGGGDGEKFQLPDIIQGQEDLNQSMEEGMESGDGEGEEGESGEEGDGNGGEEGENQENEDGQGGEDGSQYGDGQLPSEEQNSAELYEIYKEQQKLRFQLQDLIQQENLGADAQRLHDEMEKTEEELLRRGFSKKTLELMLQMKEQMIRLNEATYKQEQENEREATTNKKVYKNTKTEDLEKAKEYFQTVEILNRQFLPLQPDFKQIVQEYFKNQDD